MLALHIGCCSFLEKLIRMNGGKAVDITHLDGQSLLELFLLLSQFKVD